MKFPPQMKWYRCNRQASDNAINAVEKALKLKLPATYICLMKQCDAGVPQDTDFEYFDVSYGKYIEQAIGVFLGIEAAEYTVLGTFQDPPEFFPDGLIAFAETGNGDYICFDYRQGKDNPDPPIVYWNHEADIGKDVSFVANTFEEFLGMLKEPEEE
jgi:hypothetical protein